MGAYPKVVHLETPYPELDTRRTIGQDSQGVRSPLTGTDRSTSSTWDYTRGPVPEPIDGPVSTSGGTGYTGLLYSQTRSVHRNVKVTRGRVYTTYPSREVCHNSTLCPFHG